MHGKINKDVLYGLSSSIFNFNRSNTEKKYKLKLRGINFCPYGKKHEWKG